MEVHSHSHTVPIAIGRKKFTHYLWEFLMLFLAVFCGFIAEYLLEHKIDNEKGRQYIHLYYEDLKTDTANFSQLLLIYKDKLSHLSDRYDCFDKITKNNSATDCLIDLFEYSSNFPDLIYTDRTIQQLKNAGGIRLLKQTDADSILLYDNMLRQFKISETTSFQESQTGIRNTLYSLANFRMRKELIEKKQQKGARQLIYPENYELLNRYFNQLETYAEGCKSNYTDIEYLKLKATTLINYFKNEYHLK